MARQSIAPALADIRQDIAGPIPLDLLVQWNEGDHDRITHDALLKPYEIEGTVVCSDSSGLSKLSASMNLYDVLFHVHEPKEIIYHYGSAIGGKAMGVWAADNTQMLYDRATPVGEVLMAMAAALREIDRGLVQVGMGVSYGRYYLIGGGLYGTGVDYVEELSESYTRADEIVITENIYKRLPQKLAADCVAHAGDGDAKTREYGLVYGKLKKPCKKSLVQYPMPFDKLFFDALVHPERPDRQQVLDSFAHQKTVVLLKVHHGEQPYLLDSLTGWVLAHGMITRVLRGFKVKEVKCNGLLGIFVSDDQKQAVAFARQCVKALGDIGYPSSAALSYGDVLLFPEVGEIAGGPVNIASKLAEDMGEVGKVYVHETVRVPFRPSSQFSAMISGVKLTGRYV